MLRAASYPPTKPLRLGHILPVSPGVPASVEFTTEALDMGLADRALDVIAFRCARKSDHPVVAFNRPCTDVRAIRPADCFGPLVYGRKSSPG